MACRDHRRWAFLPRTWSPSRPVAFAEQLKAPGARPFNSARKSWCRWSRPPGTTSSSPIHRWPNGAWRPAVYAARRRGDRYSHCPLPRQPLDVLAPTHDLLFNCLGTVPSPRHDLPEPDLGSIARSDDASPFKIANGALSLFLITEFPFTFAGCTRTVSIFPQVVREEHAYYSHSNLTPLAIAL
jgi:hypothetical protein